MKKVRQSKVKVRVKLQPIFTCVLVVNLSPIQLHVFVLKSFDLFVCCYTPTTKIYKNLLGPELRPVSVVLSFLSRRVAIPTEWDARSLIITPRFYVDLASISSIPIHTPGWRRALRD